MPQIVYCPPLLTAGNSTAESGYRRCLPRIRAGAYRQLLGRVSAAVRLLWLAALHQQNYSTQRRFSAYLSLMETMKQLDCVAIFSGCFPGGLSEEERASKYLCGIFRSQMIKIKSLRVLGNSSEELANVDAHPCYSSDFFHGLGRALAGHPRDLQRQVHDMLRWRAISPAEHLIESTLARIWNNSYDLSFGLYDCTENGVNSVPMLQAPIVHSPGRICARADLPQWHRIPNISHLLSVVSPLRQGWVVNVGAADGGCIERRYGEAVDPANCLLRDGFGGIVFEASLESSKGLLRRVGHRKDVEVLVAQVDPPKVADAVKQFASGLGRDSLDLLKIDVDNCDCCFLEEVFAKDLRPRFVHVEVHSLVPPPLIFRPTSFEPSVLSSLEELGVSFSRRGHMRHCSLAAFVDILEPFGYELVRLYHFDAIFADPRSATVLRSRKILRPPKSDPVETSLAWWLGSLFCNPLRSTNFVELVYEETFLYDYRRWVDPDASAQERLEIVRAYLNHWQLEPSSYRLDLLNVGKKLLHASQ